jgi:hypothetical protein
VDDPDLDPREAARARRRDRDLSAEARDLMRPGMGKVFKQIQDAQRRLVDDAPAADPEPAESEQRSAVAPRRRRRNR